MYLMSFLPGARSKVQTNNNFTVNDIKHFHINQYAYSSTLFPFQDKTGGQEAKFETIVSSSGVPTPDRQVPTHLLHNWTLLDSLPTFSCLGSIY